MKNNLLLAFKILLRRKFYTCVSLFGISITLMVLMVVTSLIESFVHPRGPERNSDRIVVATMLSLQQRNENGTRGTNSLLGYRFIENHVLGMQTPELIGIFSGFMGELIGGGLVTGFRDGIKIRSTVKRTDHNYWKILQFDFIEGRPINAQEHEQGAYVAVISETTRGQYFSGESAVGRTINLDGQNFLVIGVVRDVSPLQAIAQADVWLPIFATALTQFRNEDHGGFTVLMLARTRAEAALIKDEYQAAVRNFSPALPTWFRPGTPLQVYSWPVSKVGVFLQLIGRTADVPPEEQNVGKLVVTALIAAAFVFMLLPVFNLVNINISRILERASEIGVRKSFGASTGHLVRQFIVENLVITALGGVLGFVLAMLALALLGQSDILKGEAFQLNYRVLALGVSYILVFGLLSAVYPAWKMSRLDPVQALKGVL